MSMIKCPECEKEISDQTYKCPNCGVVIKKPKRGITGIVLKTLFILFNAIMILWVISLLSRGDPEVDMGAVKAMGTGMLLFIWLIIGVPLGIWITIRNNEFGMTPKN